MQDGKPERRRAPRATVDIAIHLSNEGRSTGSKAPARIVNISTSGLLCRFGEAMNEMTLLGIDLELPGSKTPEHVQGAVVRCAKLRDVSPATYELGVFFTDMSADTRRNIERFVETQLATEAS